MKRKGIREIGWLAIATKKGGLSRRRRWTTRRQEETESRDAGRRGSPNVGGEDEKRLLENETGRPASEGRPAGVV